MSESNGSPAHNGKRITSSLAHQLMHGARMYRLTLLLTTFLIATNLIVTKSFADNIGLTCPDCNQKEFTLADSGVKCSCCQRSLTAGEVVTLITTSIQPAAPCSSLLSTLSDTVHSEQTAHYFQEFLQLQTSDTAYLNTHINGWVSTQISPSGFQMVYLQSIFESIFTQTNPTSVESIAVATQMATFQYIILNPHLPDMLTMSESDPLPAYIRLWLLFKLWLLIHNDSDFDPENPTYLNLYSLAIQNAPYSDICPSLQDFHTVYLQVVMNSGQIFNEQASCNYHPYPPTDKGYMELHITPGNTTAEACEPIVIRQNTPNSQSYKVINVAGLNAVIIYLSDIGLFIITAHNSLTYSAQGSSFPTYAESINAFFQGSVSPHEALHRAYRAAEVLPVSAAQMQGVGVPSSNSRRRSNQTPTSSVLCLVTGALKAMTDSFSPSLTKQQRIILILSTIGFVGYVVYWMSQVLSPPFSASESGKN